MRHPETQADAIGLAHGSAAGVVELAEEARNIVLQVHDLIRAAGGEAGQCQIAVIDEVKTQPEAVLANPEWDLGTIRGEAHRRQIVDAKLDPIDIKPLRLAEDLSH